MQRFVCIIHPLRFYMPDVGNKPQTWFPTPILPVWVSQTEVLWMNFLRFILFFSELLRVRRFFSLKIYGKELLRRKIVSLRLERRFNRIQFGICFQLFRGVDLAPATEFAFYCDYIVSRKPKKIRDNSYLYQIHLLHNQHLYNLWNRFWNTSTSIFWWYKYLWDSNEPLREK